MSAQHGKYRLVLDAAGGQAASEAATFEDVMAAFVERVASGAFRPDGDQRLLVLSEVTWRSRANSVAHAAASAA